MPESNTIVQAHWLLEPTLVNLRCEIAAPGVREAISNTLALALPEAFNTTVHNDILRILWIGPDEWLLHSSAMDAKSLETRLRNALSGQHFSVTDVSSNYQILQLAGESSRDLLAQGCPLDLHPRVFKPGDCAGSHYFKAAIWLWQPAPSSYALLIRRSFAGYVQLMIERASAEYALVIN